MIGVICHSNLDDFHPIVTMMCCRPQIGDLVECILKFQKTNLKICSITHQQKRDDISNLKSIPYLEIELGK